MTEPAAGSNPGLLSWTTPASPGAGPRALPAAWLGLALILWLAACTPESSANQAPQPDRPDTASRTPPLPPTAPVTPPPTTDPPAPRIALSSPIPTPSATASASPSPSPTPTPTATATATPPGPCVDRVPPDDLLTLVTMTYGLSRNYEPGDLVPLADHFPVQVTLGYPTEVRAVIIEPLEALIAAMQAEGLGPQIISGYRSYSTQALAYDKWLRTYPLSAPIVSARPGFSEHQLGTTVDFGSPELPALVGQPGIQFHTYFYQTSEGQWLANNAHHYGFSLSYPRDAFELTGFYYEPWHFRYVTVELATQLHQSGQTLTQYLLENRPEPCNPGP